MSDGGSFLSALGTIGAARSDSRALKAQSRTAFAQGYEDEAAQRRRARAELGEQAAAIAQAGIGYGGTAALVMEQSELNAEMDALNYRYRGVQQGTALRTQAKQVKAEGYMQAGAQLLTGYGASKNNRSILSNSGT
jgi:hypothetical protein